MFFGKKQDKDAKKADKDHPSKRYARDPSELSGSMKMFADNDTGKSSSRQSPEPVANSSGTKRDLDKYYSRCSESCGTIVTLWRKASKEVDVDNYISTVELAQYLLDRVKSSPTAVPTMGLIESAKKLSKTLKEYEKELKSIGEKLSSYLSSSRKRRGVAQHNALLHQQLRSVVEASGLDMQRHTMASNDGQPTAGTRPSLSPALPQLVTQRTRARLTVADGFKFWQKHFSELEMELVAFEDLVSALQAELQTTFDLSDVSLLQHVLDRDMVGAVTPSDFNTFLSLFGPLQNSLANAKSVYSQRWFHDFLSVDEVMRLLSDQPPGTFLVRYSRSVPGSFVLDYVHAVGQLKTLIIKSTAPNGVEYLDEQGCTLHFSSIQALVASQKDILKFPLMLDFLNKTWFCGLVSSDEAEKMLSRLPACTFLVRFADSGRFAFYVSYVTVEADGERLIKHASITKVPSGYLLDLHPAASGPTSRHRDGSIPPKPTNLVRSQREKSLSSPAKPTLNAVADAKPPSSLIYSSISALISAHSNIWKYNYDPDHVPKLPIADFKESTEPRTGTDLRGPLETDGVGTASKCGDHIFASTIATYPRGTEGYNVVCDQYFVRPMGNRIVFALADGCGWGRRPREAAIRASQTIIDQVADRTVQCKMTDSIEIRNALLRSFNVAHDAILEGKEQYWMAGATTLLAGQVIEIDAENEEWAVIAACVGDCKLFVWNSRNQRVVDLTAGNRLHARNAKDAGGSLGAQKDSAHPDLRNLASYLSLNLFDTLTFVFLNATRYDSYFWPLTSGEIVLAVSDGIHDNCDPESLGLTIKEALDAVGAKAESLSSQLLATYGVLDDLRWEKLDNSTVESIKSSYMTWRLASVLDAAEKTAGPDDSIPEILGKALLDNSRQVTKKSRDFMEAEPNRAEPRDHRSYPGKMDHSSVIAIMAGNWFDAEKLRTARSGGSIAPPRIRSTTSDEGSLSPHNVWPTSQGPIEVAAALEPGSELSRKEVKSYELSYTRVLNGTLTPQTASESKLAFAAGGVSVSTYPCILSHADAPAQRVGDPILPQYVAEITSTRILAAMSSGVHWGSVSCDAGRRALLAACGNLASLHSCIRTVDHVGKALLKSLDAAQAELQAAADIPNAPTVVMALAMVTNLMDSSWAVTVASVGNCKVFHLCTTSLHVQELTKGNAPLLRSDPGGRLGPYKNSLPNTANLLVRSCAVAEGDIIFILSPGAYWNFDPEILGLSVSQVSATDGSWSAVLKDEWRCQKIQDLLQEYCKQEVLTPSRLADCLVEHSVKVTASTRRLMENDPKATEPRDFKLFPGKMGHASCVAVRVGRLTLEEVQLSQAGHI